MAALVCARTAARCYDISVSTRLIGGLATCALAETKSSEPQQQLWSDARFASLMRDGMIDYEAQIVPVKEALLSEHLLKGSKVRGPPASTTS